MSRRLSAVVVFALAVLAGVMLAPALVGLSPAQTADGGPTSPAPPTTTSAEVTWSTDAATPSATAAALTEEQQTDLLAGVRSHLVTDEGSGELRVVSGDSDAPDGDAPVTTVRVEVEEGLDIDDQAFAAFVMDTLNDPRGWGADGSVRFARTDGQADVRVVLATPSTVDAMCSPLATNGTWSCGRDGHAALNADRWVFGADAWLEGDGSLTGYRRYLVNHEVGHLLGHPHAQCPADGDRAPVMVQQSISLQGCRPNGWPFP